MYHILEIVGPILDDRLKEKHQILHRDDQEWWMIHRRDSQQSLRSLEGNVGNGLKVQRMVQLKASSKSTEDLGTLSCSPMAQWSGVPSLVGRSVRERVIRYIP